MYVCNILYEICSRPPWLYISFSFVVRASALCTQFVTMRKKQSLGIGAKLNLGKNVIHPSKVVSETDAWMNISPRQKVEGFLVIGRDTKTIRGKSVDDAILMRHELVDNVIFYCHPKFASQKAILEEGPAERFFKVPEVVVNSAHVTPPAFCTAVARTAVEESVPEVPVELRSLSVSNAEDIKLVLAMGFSVDDDNDPHQRMFQKYQVRQLRMVFWKVKSSILT